MEKQRVIEQALDATHSGAALEAAIKAAEETARQTAHRAAQARQLPALAPDQQQAVHEGLRLLAGRCDGARSLDGVGFSGLHAEFGASLARQGGLSERQAVAGQRILNAYRRTQLPAELVARIWP